MPGILGSSPLYKMAWYYILEKEMATHSSILDWRILWTEEPGGLLSMELNRVRHDWSDLACMHAFQKEMATHSSILAWRIPETEEPGGLPSMGSHRVRHYWSDLAQIVTNHQMLPEGQLNPPLLTHTTHCWLSYSVFLFWIPIYIWICFWISLLCPLISVPHGHTVNHNCWSFMWQFYIWKENFLP